MILFFDTETTGFYDDRSSPDAECQPYIVQLAARLCDDEGVSKSEFSFIVDPGISDGISIPQRASYVHGITNEIAVEFGVSSSFALSAFTHLYQRSELVVAHNVKFDRAIIETAIARHYGKLLPLRKPLFCTMEASTPIVNLPPTERMVAAGFDKPKPPKLEECISHFFQETMENAHDALADVDACSRVYFMLKQIGKA